MGKASTIGHHVRYCRKLRKKFLMSRDPISSLGLVRYPKQVSLLKVKHLPLAHTTLTGNYIAAATVPPAGSVMTCHLSAHRFRPYVKVMEHPAAGVAVEVAVVAGVEDVEVEEDDIKRRSENWRNYK